MSDYLTYVWRPVTGGRHAFPITATKTPAGVPVVAFCGAEADAVELHDRSEVDWIREDTCMDCWRRITAGWATGP
ncbi:zinc finger protein [Saccharopolyspora sp. NPDC050389]|uniref:zinc finger protein n=1 Tax=Saccharopolyspora sp. NPDC050389 TaxID=3155516 RepID=UPI0033E6B674